MPFIARTGRPGLLGLAARTAVVAGTATAVSGAVARHQHDRAVQAAAEARASMTPPPRVPEAAAAAIIPPAPSPNPATAGGDDLMSRLNQLVTLQQQGLLTPEEFALAKQRLLAD